jgi:hypothetical protein
MLTQQAVRDARRAAGAPRDLGGAVVVEDDTRMVTEPDAVQLVGAVEVESERRA